MTDEQQERLVKAFEDMADAARRIARSHEGLELSAKKAVDSLWPEPKQPRQAVVSHVQTEEEKLRERQQGTEQSTPDWLNGDFIGERERAWIAEHPKEEPAQQKSSPGPEATSPKTDQDQA